MDKVSGWRLRVLSKQIGIDQVSVGMVSISNSVSLHVAYIGSEIDFLMLHGPNFVTLGASNLAL